MSNRVVTCFVPFLPTVILSPNRGERRGGRVPEQIIEAKAQMRSDTCLWLLTLAQVKAIGAPFPYARVSVEVSWDKRKQDGVYRPSDITNAIYSLKAFFDGLIDAGLIVDDDCLHMELGRSRVVPKHLPEGVTVTVEECDPEP